MTDRQGLESAPFPETVCPGIFAQQDIFMADTMLTLSVYARLIRCHHAREKRLAVEILSDALRTFMHTEIEADTMACPMPEIASCLPKCIPRQDIQLASCSTGRKYRHGKLDHPFEHKGVILHLKGSAFPEGDCSRNIGSAETVLTA